jgi:hypothetical protein
MKLQPRNPFAGQSKKSNADSRVIIGAYVPESLVQELSANALYSGISRSALIEAALTYFMKNYKKPESDIVTKLSRRVLAEWDSFRTVSSGKMNWDERDSFAKYRASILKALKKKGLKNELINKIMERIR